MIKKILVAAGVIAALGLLIAAIAFAAGADEMLDYKANANTYTADGDFTNMVISALSADIKIERSKDGSCYAICEEKKNFKFTLEVSDGTLFLTAHDERLWYQYIGIFTSCEATLYLPGEVYSSISVSTGSGDIECKDGFTFTEAAVTALSGDIDFCSNVTGFAEFKVSSGGVDIYGSTFDNILIRAVSGGVDIRDITADEVAVDVTSGSVDVIGEFSKIDVETLSGSIDLKRTIASESMTLKATSGSVRLDACDSPLISIKTSSGSVRGTLLTGKMFDVKVSSGSSDCPASVEGSGSCSIRTSSGNVKIRIKE